MEATKATRSYHFVRYFPERGGATAAADGDDCLGAYRWLATMRVPHMVGEALGLWRAIAAAGGRLCDAISAAEVQAALRGKPLAAPDPVVKAGTVLAVLARRARKSLPETPQCALDWALYGSPGGQPRLGDIVCTRSDGGAYAGIYVGEDDVAYHLLGATADDRIGVTRVGKVDLYAVRRPLYECMDFAPCGIRLDRDGHRAAA